MTFIVSGGVSEGLPEVRPVIQTGPEKLEGSGPSEA